MKLIVEGTLDEIREFIAPITLDSVHGLSPADLARKDRKPEGVLAGGTGGERDVLIPGGSVQPASAAANHPEDRNKLVIPKLPTKEDLCIPEFEYERKLEKSYKPLFIAELPDSRVVLKYFSARIFTTKEKILRIPYPIPNGYLKAFGQSPNSITAIRKYREYLETRSVPMAPEISGDIRDIKDPDAAFKPVLGGVINTRVGREDTDQLGGSEA